LVKYALTKNRKKKNGKKFPVAEFTFDSSRKCMTTIHQTEKEYWLLPKGCRSTISKIDEHQKPLVSAFERKQTK
jgi:Ca2+-transporting ATPase